MYLTMYNIKYYFVLYLLNTACSLLIIDFWVSFTLSPNAVPANMFFFNNHKLEYDNSHDPISSSLATCFQYFIFVIFKILFLFYYVFTGSYSCLRVDFVFKREFSFYLIQYYVPCCMLVIVSWVSFWLDARSVPARVALGVTTLLTMSTQTSSINQSLPPVSYTKVHF